MLRMRTAWLRIALPMLLLIAGLVAVAVPATAQPVDQKKRWTARKLGGEGIDLYEAGDFAAALEKFTTADELVPAPTVKLYAARCLDKLDRMLEAARVYRDTIEFVLDRRSPTVHHEARKSAVKELATLMDEIPTVEVVVRGQGAGEAVVQLDGRELAAEDLGKKLQIDPGAHAVKASRSADERVVQQTVVVQRGEAGQVTLQLPDAEEPAPVKPLAPGGDPDLGDGWRLGGWTTTAISGAVLVAGAVVGVLALDKSGTLSDQCPEQQCPPDKQGDVDSLDTLRAVSSIGIITGATGLLSGVLMLALAPSADEATAPAGEPPTDLDFAVGPTAAGLGVLVSGSF